MPALAQAECPPCGNQQIKELSVKKVLGTAAVLAFLSAEPGFAQNGTLVIRPDSPADTAANQSAIDKGARDRADDDATTDGFIEFEHANSVRAGALIGSVVIDVESIEVGQVEDVIFDRHGLISGLVISVGGFLGMGSRRVAVPIDRAKVYRNESGEKFIVALENKSEELELAPNFKTHQEQRKAAERATGTR